MTEINPYNFVPLRDGTLNRESPPLWERLLPKHYNGFLVCDLIAYRPLISRGHQRHDLCTLLDQDGRPLKDHKGKEDKSIKVFRFLRNSQDQPILQGTSLKGLIRSVYEALTDSCLTLAAVEGSAKKAKISIPYKYTLPDRYKNSSCNSVACLCPACRLFGTIEGDTVHYQGRVVFGDAGLIEGNLLQKRFFLKELSHPKPFHHATYGKSRTAGGQIAGRKFYYHHGPNPQFAVEQHQSNDRSFAIEELAPKNSKFRFTVTLTNLKEDELGKLLLALELDSKGELAHKIGSGKAIGLGTCRIQVEQSASVIFQAANRYTQWSNAPSTGWYSLKNPDSLLSAHLREVLRLDKVKDGSIEYPGWPGYPSDPIDDKGFFGGSYKIASTLSSALPGTCSSASAASTPTISPPSLGPNMIAAWLKAVDQAHRLLVFMDTDGQEHVRPMASFQGKQNLLELGQWYILWGEKASRRAP